MRDGEKSYYHKNAFTYCSSILLGFQAGVLVWNSSSSLSNKIKLPLSIVVFLGTIASSVIANGIAKRYSESTTDSQDIKAKQYEKSIFVVTSSLLSSLRVWQRYPLDGGFYGLCWGVQYLEKSSGLWINVDDYYKGKKRTNIKIPILSMSFWLCSYIDEDFKFLSWAIGGFIPKSFSYIAVPLTCCYMLYSLYKECMSLDSNCNSFVAKTEVELKEQTTFGFIADGAKQLASFNNNKLFFKRCFYIIPEALFSLSSIPFSDFKVKYNIIYPLYSYFTSVPNKEGGAVTKAANRDSQEGAVTKAANRDSQEGAVTKAANRDSQVIAL